LHADDVLPMSPNSVTHVPGPHTCPGYPRFACGNPKDVDARHKAGHDGICKLRFAYFIASAGSMNFFTTNAL